MPDERMPLDLHTPAEPPPEPTQEDVGARISALIQELTALQRDATALGMPAAAVLHRALRSLLAEGYR
jgi:hypothetical protein